jgi:hypothetical protein
LCVYCVLEFDLVCAHACAGASILFDLLMHQHDEGNPLDLNGYGAEASFDDSDNMVCAMKFSFLKTELLSDKIQFRSFLYMTVILSKN